MRDTTEEKIKTFAWLVGNAIERINRHVGAQLEHESLEAEVLTTVLSREIYTLEQLVGGVLDGQGIDLGEFPRDEDGKDDEPEFAAVLLERYGTIVAACNAAGVLSPRPLPVVDRRGDPAEPGRGG